MKTQILRLLVLTSLMGLLQARAETQAQLGIQTYAGLSITGAVGTVYSVEYVTDLSQTNEWRCLTFLQLPAINYLWFDPTAPATGRRFYRAVQFGAPTNLVFIPPGTFRMGSPTNEVDRNDNEGPQTAVTISRGFWMGKYLVTQGDYLSLMGSNPSSFSTNNGYSDDLTRPVEGVSWSDATNYCGVLTQRERGAGRIRTNSVYRLPTEAEWEYACRGWTSTRFSYGDDPGYMNLTNYAWYDMHGNVFEWCQDLYGLYPGGIALDPQGSPTGSYRVIRGGLWNGLARICRSARRPIS